MIRDIDKLTNDELDQLILEQDASAGKRALDSVYKLLGRFVAFPSANDRVAVTLWVAHTHIIHLVDSTPRLAILSPEPSSGKTRALETIADLVPRPIKTVNCSPNYLFRKVGSKEGLPTVLFDEIDTIFGPKAKDNEEIRGWLNAGHRRGATAGRCVVRGKRIETEELPAYAAVAMAGLGWLPDTIMTRSVIIRMRRRHTGEKVEAFRERDYSQLAAPIRVALETWAGSCEINEWPKMPPEIQDRDADVWDALLALADLSGGDWPRL
jgi:hypothetical protein